MVEGHHDMSEEVLVALHSYLLALAFLGRQFCCLHYFLGVELAILNHHILREQSRGSHVEGRRVCSRLGTCWPRPLRCTAHIRNS